MTFYRAASRKGYAIQDGVTASARKPNDAIEIRLGQIPFANQVELSGEEIVCCGGMGAKRECVVCVDRYGDIGAARKTTHASADGSDTPVYDLVNPDCHGAPHVFSPARVPLWRPQTRRR
jgi:hypothetical protein